MRLVPARIVPGPAGVSSARPLGRGRAACASGRRVPCEAVEAAQVARRLLADARHRASEIVAAAQREAAESLLAAEARGRAEGVAELAARAVRLAAREARAEERQVDRAVDLAKLLAERLLGEALALEPNRVLALAREALRETLPARQVAIFAHPQDAARLQQSVGSLTAADRVLTVKPDPNRRRGNLRFETELGVLDAALGPQLERLADKLREALSR